MELQTAALHKAGCKKIFEDRVSGTRAERPGLTQAREGLRAGDTLVVETGSAGRSVKPLVDLVGELQQQGVSSKPDRLHRYRNTFRPILLPCHGQPG